MTLQKKSFDTLIRKGAKLTDDLILFVDSGISLDELSSALHDRVRSTNLNTIMVVNDGMTEPTLTMRLPQMALK